MSIPRYYRHLVYQGSDYQARFSFKHDGVPLSLAGYSFASSIYLAGKSIADFVITIPNPENGQIYLKLEDTVTATLNGKYTHELKMVNPLGDISFPINGDLIVRTRR